MLGFGNLWFCAFVMLGCLNDCMVSMLLWFASSLVKYFVFDGVLDVCKFLMDVGGLQVLSLLLCRFKVSYIIDIISYYLQLSD